MFWRDLCSGEIGGPGPTTGPPPWGPHRGIPRDTPGNSLVDSLGFPRGFPSRAPVETLQLEFAVELLMNRCSFVIRNDNYTVLGGS